MKNFSLSSLAHLLAAAHGPHLTTAFSGTPRFALKPPSYKHVLSRELSIPSSTVATIALHSTPEGTNNEDSESNKNNNKNNPYSDPDYPDLEFINYDDPNYQAFQDDNDDFPTTTTPGLSQDETLAEIESMREDRRKRNDEFQFETYHSKVLRNGQVSTRGEWTVFQTDTFMEKDASSQRKEGARHIPRLLKWDKVLKVISSGSKAIIDKDAEWRVDGERIVHTETLADIHDFPYKENVEIQWDAQDRLHVQNTFWPDQMTSLDFRGPGGNMCVGKAYTICDATPMIQSGNSNNENEGERHEGPFSEMRTELGVTDGDLRFRIKLDYATLEEDDEIALNIPPALHLRTLTVCRETLDGFWPKPVDNGINLEAEEDMTTLPQSNARRKDQDRVDVRLFGPTGAPGGLYDPPPVGSEERAVQNYMLLDFEGGATVLLPHRLDQHDTDSEFGWVTSLDWTPGKIRYQVDRKVFGGTKLKGLKTLELSEVRGEDADRWRPKDGGVDMRQ